MAAKLPQLLPLRALRYDSRAVPDLAAVLCPPYDVISPAERARLAARDAHNAVHLELPAEPAAGSTATDRYAAAGRLFADWQATDVLRLDAQPALYVYEQLYRLPADGAVGRRARGFFCRLRLEPPGGGVRRHERTLAGPKEDRLRLLRAVRANLSPVLLLYADGAAGARSAALLDELAAGAPAAQATDDAGTLHRLWPADPATAAGGALVGMAAAGPLTIADGHHRYETALRYADEVRARDAGAAAAAADVVLALLFDAASGGLTLLPTHRLVHCLPAAESLPDAAAELFTLESQDDGDVLARRVADAGPGTLGLWTRAGGFVLRPRAAALAEHLPAGSAALRSLDVSVLGAALRRLVGEDPDRLAEAGRLSYTKDAADGLAQVADGRADACFLLAATPVESVLAVAGASELMPPKSTYFVPKAATGLVFNRLDEGQR
jgi:uncharacterized protein (DUF1015 family)